MKALIFREPHLAEIGEWEEPDLLPGEVLLEVAACGICGTDLHVYRGLPAHWPVPGVRGHELAGRVLAWADDVKGFQEGDRAVVQPMVYCGHCGPCRAGRTNLCLNVQLIGGERPGGFAERVAVPAHRLFKIPETLDLKHAALVESLATPVHAFEHNLCGMLHSVAILGAGPQGLLAMQIAQLTGAKVIAVSDVIPHRLGTAQELGATRVIDAGRKDPVETILAMTHGEGVDLAIEAAGRPETRQQAVQVLRPGGMGIFMALGTQQTTVDFMPIVTREYQLRGTQCYTDADFARAVDLLAAGDVHVAPLITEAPLGAGPEVFEMLATDPGQAIKVVLVP